MTERDILRVAVQAAGEKKAENIVALNMKGLSLIHISEPTRRS